ncbi:MAG: hypothetical protein ACE5E9_13690 [Nitrospinaceae bacterium]
MTRLRKGMLVGMLVGLISGYGSGGVLAQSSKECDPVSVKPVKLEAWVSRRYARELKPLRREFAAMGNTRVRLWVYPGNNPSRVVAVGRCVPAYIARHALRKALQLSGGVTRLVHQGFISSHWIGIATSLFDEGSQKSITQSQLERLMDDSLDTLEFQELYREFTPQDDEVQAFGLHLPNPKLLEK